jgi:hypothetical protein
MSKDWSGLFGTLMMLVIENTSSGAAGAGVANSQGAKTTPRLCFSAF